MKLYQYNKKIWDNNEVDHIWQFGIIKNRALLWVNYETPGFVIRYCRGINILFCFFGSSLFEVGLQQRKFGLAFAFFTEYFDGWE